MPSSQLSSQELDEQRMAELERYQLPAQRDRPELTGLAELAARVGKVRSSMLTFIDDRALHSLAEVGVHPITVPRSEAICSAVLHDGEPFISPDLSQDSRFSDYPAVTSGLARFWATFQLVMPSGVPVGSLCVFDPEPRDLDDGQRRVLADVADRVVDVVVLDQRNRDLDAAASELRRSNEALAAFAGQVSHDLRNPLTAVAANLELLGDALDELTDGTDGGVESPRLDDVRVLLARSGRSVGRMAALVDDMLDLASAGREPVLVEVDTQAAVTVVCDDLGSALGGVEVQVGPLEPVLADPAMLRVVVQNLLTNAAKFAATGSPATVPTATVQVRTELTAAAWRLLVVDHGPGIRPKDRERVFDPFVRLDPSRPGTGVGLATCRRLAEAHGGSVGVEETPGGGATVWIELPRARA